MFYNRHTFVNFLLELTPVRPPPCPQKKGFKLINNKFDVILEQLSYHHAILASVGLMCIVMIILACVYKKYYGVDCLPKSKRTSKSEDNDSFM